MAKKTTPKTRTPKAQKPAPRQVIMERMTRDQLIEVIEALVRSKVFLFGPSAAVIMGPLDTFDATTGKITRYGLTMGRQQLPGRARKMSPQARTAAIRKLEAHAVALKKLETHAQRTRDGRKGARK